MVLPFLFVTGSATSWMHHLVLRELFPLSARTIKRSIAINAMVKILKNKGFNVIQGSEYCCSIPLLITCCAFLGIFLKSCRHPLNS
jgi:hypothetical protein